MNTSPLLQTITDLLATCGRKPETLVQRIQFGDEAREVLLPATLQALAEVVKAVEEAPHAMGCPFWTNPHTERPCTCWKSRALTSAASRLAQHEREGE